MLSQPDQKHRIKPNHGYWRTNSFPIGGDFHRAGNEGIEIAELIRDIDPPYRGCSIEVQLANGDRAAVSSSSIELCS
ncbi:MAG: hypothetical protein ACYST2_06775 [Planctomycetota bacterium]|jgi:hypothetical protein